MQARAKTIDKNCTNVRLYKGFIAYNPVHCITKTEEPKELEIFRKVPLIQLTLRES